MSIIEMNLTAYTEDPTQALAAWETLARVAAGFGFEGIHVETSIDRTTLDSDDDVELEDHTITDDS